MKVFISGASGLLGGNCLSYFKKMGLDVVGSHLTFPTEATVFYDTLDPGGKKNFPLADFRPDVIVHCGALTHVDYCEQHVAESYQKNVTSTEYMVQVAKKLGAKLVFISTDYVFDGVAGPYVETDVTNPLSIYGTHKLKAERIVAQGLADYLILRITNVYGDEIRQKNFVARILKQCRENAELALRLPVDQFASPTNALDVARALFLLLRHEKTGIYHIGGSDYMNRVTLALKVLAGFPQVNYNLEAVATAALGQPASRPLRGGFITQRFLYEFPEFLFSSIDSYLWQQRT